MAIIFMATELLIKVMMKKNSSYAEPLGPDLTPRISVEVTNRTYELIHIIRDLWFPNEEEPMTAGDFINVMCCSIIYRKHRKKK